MTNEISEREMNLSMYSDIHKDAYSFRPRDWDRIRSMTDAELEEEIHYLSGIAAQEAEIEAKAEAEAEVELRGRHKALMDEQGIDAATAWRWILQAESTYENEMVQDLGYFVWNMRVGCGSRGHALEAEIRKLLEAEA